MKSSNEKSTTSEFLSVERPVKRTWIKPELEEMRIHLAGGDGGDLAGETTS